MRQFEIWWADLPSPMGRRPVLLLSRDQAYSILSRCSAAEVSTTIRDIPVEVRLGKEEGLDRECAANLDNLHAVRIRNLTERAGRLAPSRVHEVWRALGYALNIHALKATPS